MPSESTKLQSTTRELLNYVAEHLDELDPRLRKDFAKRIKRSFTSRFDYKARQLPGNLIHEFQQILPQCSRDWRNESDHVADLLETILAELATLRSNIDENFQELAASIKADVQNFLSNPDIVSILTPVPQGPSREKLRMRQAARQTDEINRAVKVLIESLNQVLLQLKRSQEAGYLTAHASAKVVELLEGILECENPSELCDYLKDNWVSLLLHANETIYGEVPPVKKHIRLISRVPHDFEISRRYSTLMTTMHSTVRGFIRKFSADI